MMWQHTRSPKSQALCIFADRVTCIPSYPLRDSMFDTFTSRPLQGPIGHFVLMLPAHRVEPGVLLTIAFAVGFPIMSHTLMFQYSCRFNDVAAYRES